MSKYRLTILMDVYEDADEPTWQDLSEGVRSALDEYGEIKEIRHEDEECIRKNDNLDKLLRNCHIWETPDEVNRVDSMSDKLNVLIKAAKLRGIITQQRDAVSDWEDAVQNSSSMMSCSACAYRSYNDTDGIFCGSPSKACRPKWHGLQEGK